MSMRTLELMRQLVNMPALGRLQIVLPNGDVAFIEKVTFSIAPISTEVAPRRFVQIHITTPIATRSRVRRALGALIWRAKKRAVRHGA